MSHPLWRMWISLLLLFWPLLAMGETIHVAVAANFKGTFAALASRFEQESGHTLLISSGSSGKLSTQIRQGAPFQLFLSADLARPQQLLAAGVAEPDSLFVYARGRLVLWSPDPKRFANGVEPLQTGALRRIALGNPRSVPYGQAAQETLKALGVSQLYAERRVFGEDVGQVMAFVTSGNVEAGFVSFAQILDPQGKPRPGSFWEVPAALHHPLQQGAIRLRQPHGAEATRTLIRFLRAPATVALLEQHGYLPPVPAPESANR